ncbi:hypothetical protein Raf01_28990 [Rugosimonospora africana]|uniref:OmpR/PhoB-type domain-containing protein n=1 Tax=Rugosimonospora africana TaxID=556532 RepID=A0A8J3VQ74_9ACTN|nr:hypothetical protein Raf01_28990 [Rugosimonospora africana]
MVDGNGLRVGILGPLEVSRDGEPVVLAGEKLAVVLAVLASAAGRPVGGGALADRVWPDRLPERVRGSLQTLIMRLRRALGPGAIATVGDGYRLDVEPDHVDLLRFRRLVGEAVAADHPGTARELLGEALGLWRGDPLTGVRSPSLDRDEIPGLIEERLAALHRRVELDLAAGRHDAVTAELRELTGRYPLRESLWRQLIVALIAAGRPAEAIQAYHAVRTRLADELGIDPSAALQSLYRGLLHGDDDSAGPGSPARADAPSPDRSGADVACIDTDGADIGGTDASGADMGSTDASARAGADSRRLLGRHREVDALDRWLASATADGSMPTVAALVGPAGIGKTALALCWADRQHDRFPDGRLHLDLRGYGPHAPLAPERALESLLHELRVPAEDIPPGLDERASLLRTAIGARRMVVLLDNARDAAQVRPLLPGPGCLVVVTSRSQLRGLVAYDGAYRVALGRIRVPDARALLDATAEAGPHRYDNDDIAKVVDRCAGLPLALRIVAERLARNGCDLSAIVAELDGPDGRLDALRTGDDDLTDMRTVLSWSYRALDPDAARAFRLAGAQPGADLDPAAAAILLGLTRPETGAILDRLVGAHLLERQPTGRYRMPGLLRAYAAELSRAVDEDRMAIRALLDWYVGDPAGTRPRAHPAGAPASYALPAGRLPGGREAARYP